MGYINRKPPSADIGERPSELHTLASGRSEGGPNDSPFQAIGDIAARDAFARRIAAVEFGWRAWRFRDDGDRHAGVCDPRPPVRSRIRAWRGA